MTEDMNNMRELLAKSAEGMKVGELSPMQRDALRIVMAGVRGFAIQEPDAVEVLLERLSSPELVAAVLYLSLGVAGKYARLLAEHEGAEPDMEWILNRYLFG